MVELDIIGFSHPLIGALVARRWHFPAAVSEIKLL
jgi:HD-like signal output (HDOD) protein